MRKVLYVIAAATLLAAGFFVGMQLPEGGPAQPPPDRSGTPEVGPATEPLTAEPESAFSRREARPPLAEPPAGAVRGRATLSYGPRQIDEALDWLRANGLEVTGVIRELGIVQIRYDAESRQRLAAALGEDLAVGFDYPAELPRPVPVSSESGYLAVGERWKQLLKADALSTAGEGVTIAVIDQGDFSHPHLPKGAVDVRRRRGGSGDHGAQVASLLLAEGSPARDATILGWNAAGADGAPDTFAVAEAIVDAVAAGADVVNLSLGSYGDSPALAQAVALAQAHGVVIVAAAGNDNSGDPLYPAAYSAVFGTSATDGKPQRAAFSNRGASVSVAGPGVGVTVPGYDPETGDPANVLASGTSFAAPLFSASIAGVMTELGISAAEAATRLTETARDLGQPGHDPHLGAGLPDLARATRDPDEAIAALEFTSVYHQPPGPIGGGGVWLVIQNTGNVPLETIDILSQTEAGTNREHVLSLAPNESRGHWIALPNALPEGGLLVEGFATYHAQGEPGTRTAGVRTGLRAPGP
ncbi:MAG: S8 family serine peptidase [Opitutales bacterium]